MNEENAFLQTLAIFIHRTAKISTYHPILLRQSIGFAAALVYYLRWRTGLRMYAKPTGVHRLCAASDSGVLQLICIGDEAVGVAHDSNIATLNQPAWLAGANLS